MEGKMNKIAALTVIVPMLAAFPQVSHAVVAVPYSQYILDDFAGDDAQVILDVYGEGTSSVTFNVSLGSGTIADIRGLYFDWDGVLDNVSLTEPIVTYADGTTSGGNITYLGAGRLLPPATPYDGGVEIGVNGIGINSYGVADDVRYATFTISADQNINFDRFGARLTSVLVGDKRNGSSKLSVIADGPGPTPTPEPGTVAMIGVGLTLARLVRSRKQFSQA